MQTYKFIIIGLSVFILQYYCLKIKTKPYLRMLPVIITVISLLVGIFLSSGLFGNYLNLCKLLMKVVGVLTIAVCLALLLDRIEKIFKN